MSVQPLTTLVIRILAFYLVANAAINFLPMILASNIFDESEVNTSEGILITLFISTILVGVILWFIAPFITSKLAPANTSQESLSEQGIVNAGTFLIGIYWLYSSGLMLLVQLIHDGSISYGHAIILLLSVFLILQGKQITRFYNRVRAFGSDI